jgi:hypothetical protein
MSSRHVPQSPPAPQARSTASSVVAPDAARASIRESVTARQIQTYMTTPGLSDAQADFDSHFQ